MYDDPLRPDHIIREARGRIGHQLEELETLTVTRTGSCRGTILFGVEYLCDLIANILEVDTGCLVGSAGECCAGRRIKGTQL